MRYPGTYIFESISSIDIDGLIYSSHFDPTSPEQNQYTSDANSVGNGQFRIQETFPADQDFYLVVTTGTPGVIGSFTIIASGRSFGNFTHIECTLFYI